ncbi:hypothetical protein F5Y04DRAFT_208926 [Hypomontagnella monticulosa]|nr:hypothetical protein F5Y04DRAFT_208926 [Hypomontagnella monticulosa]
MAALLYEEHNDSPWIFDHLEGDNQLPIQPTPSAQEGDEFPLEHLPKCPHHILADRKIPLAEVPHNEVQEPHNELSRSSITRMLQGLCGIAGVCPKSRDRESWTGYVEFPGENVAVVSYGPSEDGLYEKPLLERICSGLLGFCIAASNIRRYGLCCNCFTVLVRSEAGADPYHLAHLRQLSLDSGSHLLSILQKGNDSVFEAASYALDIVKLVAPTAIFDAEGSTKACLHICALATQFLCVGLVSYAQAHVGPIQPFFLDTKLNTIHLLGISDYPPSGISVGLVGLACMGGMIRDQAIIFELLTIDVNETERERREYFISSNIGDLIDTWGPGELIVDRDSATRVLAIRLGGGVIWCPDSEESIFHWSQDLHPLLPELVSISNNTLLVIGSPVTYNQHCRHRKEQFQESSTCHFQQLGTSKPHWAPSEIQFGLQGGQYAVFQGNVTWQKVPGRTLKQSRLEQSDDMLVSFLDDLWGLQVSYCTGIARRVPIRQVVADAIDSFLSVYNGTQEEIDTWMELRKLHIIEELREPNFQQFLIRTSQTKPELVPVIKKMIGQILRHLGPTGFDQDGNLVAACFWGQDPS